MAEERRALIFSETTGTDPVIVDALTRAGLKALWPWELGDALIEVSLVVIDKLSTNAHRISANLRAQERRFALILCAFVDSLSMTTSDTSIKASPSSQGQSALRPARVNASTMTGSVPVVSEKMRARLSSAICQSVFADPAAQLEAGHPALSGRRF